jgi:predicted nuclease with TOPRIM domain
MKMPKKDIEDQLAELARRVEALEARLAELESTRALREAEPVYRIDEAEGDLSMFDERFKALLGQFFELATDWDDVRAMIEAEADYRAGDTMSFDDFFAELEAEVE